MLICWSICCSILINLFTQTSTTYYISSTGNDNNDGTSIKTAWKSISKVNQLQLKKGDRVLLEGGMIFEGNIRLDEKDADGISIGNYGTGKPIIFAGKEAGIFIHNRAGVTLFNLSVVGRGVGTNTGSGIHFYADKSSPDLKDIDIRDCDVKGFQLYGILIQSDKDSTCGYRNVRITRCVTTENGEAGIGSLASYPSIPHFNFNVKDCVAHNNRGIQSKTDSHSGNGIVLSGVDSFTVDRCEAYENGEDCRSVAGGPVGIWVWNCRNGVIQNSVSHNNHSGTCPHDGGGFDIDGGSSNCVIRRCTSYSNEGAGYLVCEFGSPQPFKNNKVESNSSRNDGLKNGYGAITISGAGAAYPVTSTVIRKNKIIVENKGVVNGKPSAIYINNSDCRDILIEANDFEIMRGTLVLRTDSLFTSSQIGFRNNNYITDGNKFPVECRKCKDAKATNWNEILTARK